MNPWYAFYLNLFMIICPNLFSDNQMRNRSQERAHGKIARWRDERFHIPFQIIFEWDFSCIFFSFQQHFHHYEFRQKSFPYWIGELRMNLNIHVSSEIMRSLNAMSSTDIRDWTIRALFFNEMLEHINRKSMIWRKSSPHVEMHRKNIIPILQMSNNRQHLR